MERHPMLIPSRRVFLRALGAAAMYPLALEGVGRAQITAGTSTGAAAIRLAVPEFDARAQDARLQTLTALFNQTLWNDLEFSGILTLISRSFYPLGRVSGEPDIQPAAWTNEVVDADFMNFGNIYVRPDGRIAVEAYLWDLQAPPIDRRVLGNLYTSEPTDPGARVLAHKVADDVVQVLGGGIKGVAQTKIAYESRVGTQEKAIFVMDYDGENQRQITLPGVLAVTPNWSPDSQRIAYTSYEREKADIAVISPTDRRGFPFDVFPGTTSTPAFSPDGTRVAFSSSKEELRGQRDIELWVGDVSGRNLRRLTTSVGVDISPSWNPRTGQHLAFVSDRSGSPEIYTVDVEGGNLRRLTSAGGEASDPAWHPNGTLIAFSWQPSRQSTKDIYLHDMASGQNQQLTRNAGYNENPSWSPDGRHVAFESDRSGTVQIYSMLANGSRVQQLTRQGRNSNPAWSNYVVGPE